MKMPDSLVDEFLANTIPELRQSAYDNIRNLYYCQIPVYIPAFNNPTYVVHMVRQLYRYRFRNITVADNHSDYDKMHAVLDKLQSDQVCNVIRFPENRGPRHIVQAEDIYASLPDLFCLTDPDISFNAHLPVDFMTQLTLLTEHFKIGKAGFALSLKHKGRMKREKYLNAREIGPTHIWEWESQFWRYQLGTLPGGSGVFNAPIDTTFALYNKKYFHPDQFFQALRVSGVYESEHTPWYRDSFVPEEEERAYRKTQKFSTYQAACV